MDRPQKTEGTMGEANLSIGSNLDSTSASRGSETTTTTPPSQSSYQPFLGESNDLVVPPNARIIRPRSLNDIYDAIEDLKAELDTHTVETHTPRPSQFIWAYQIPQGLFTQIETDLELFPGVRTTIAHNDFAVLLKIMPGRQRERITGNFRVIVMGHLNAMGLSLQNGDFTDQGAEITRGFLQSKEPDWAFGPYDARINSAADEYPATEYASLILETGFSESLGQLQLDAHWWYRNTTQETKIVVLIDVASDNPYRVNFEVWTEVPNQSHAPVTRNCPAQVVQCTQRATLQNGVVTGGPLILSFPTLMRRAPRAGEHDIVLGAADLAIIGARPRPAP
ncbi:hypothetical protein CBS147325_5915 [Penicillium roqueforti]|nr:hypothetical protein CBS147325_5915 [Penicillium roqueforti]KAI3150448.1 hypothetical protein DTO046C5_9545 [Penicillium roqueforti]